MSSISDKSFPAHVKIEHVGQQDQDTTELGQLIPVVKKEDFSNVIKAEPLVLNLKIRNVLDCDNQFDEKPEKKVIVSKVNEILVRTQCKVEDLVPVVKVSRLSKLQQLGISTSSPSQKQVTVGFDQPGDCIQPKSYFAYH